MNAFPADRILKSKLAIRILKVIGEEFLIRDHTDRINWTAYVSKKRFFPDEINLVPTGPSGQRTLHWIVGGRYTSPDAVHPYCYDDEKMRKSKWIDDQHRIKEAIKRKFWLSPNEKKTEIFYQGPILYNKWDLTRRHPPQGPYHILRAFLRYRGSKVFDFLKRKDYRSRHFRAIKDESGKDSMVETSSTISPFGVFSWTMGPPTHSKWVDASVYGKRKERCNLIITIDSCYLPGEVVLESETE